VRLPAGTVIEAGTATTFGGEADNATVAPLVGAGPERVTVALKEFPEDTVAAEIVKD
jgi:hypothetical protein